MDKKEFDKIKKELDDYFEYMRIEEKARLIGFLFLSAWNRKKEQGNKESNNG